MNNSNSITDFREIDYRVHSLYSIIDGLEIAIIGLKSKIHKIEWYDGAWLKEEAEPIYGLAFIAFQNYVNGTIFDLTGSSVDKHKYYRLNPCFEHYSRSKIELIVGLANYFKHRDDDGPFSPGTFKILDSFELNTSKDAVIIDSSPVFEGLTILNDNWDLSEIISIVKDWRANLLNVTILKDRS